MGQPQILSVKSDETYDNHWALKSQTCCETKKLLHKIMTIKAPLSPCLP